MPPLYYNTLCSSSFATKSNKRRTNSGKLNKMFHQMSPDPRLATTENNHYVHEGLQLAGGALRQQQREKSIKRKTFRFLVLSTRISVNTSLRASAQAQHSCLPTTITTITLPRSSSRAVTSACQVLTVTCLQDHNLPSHPEGHASSFSNKHLNSTFPC